MSSEFWGLEMQNGQNTGKGPETAPILDRQLALHNDKVRDSETRPCSACSVVKPGEAFNKGRGRCRICEKEDRTQAKNGHERLHEYWILEGSKIVRTFRSREEALYAMSQLFEYGEYVSPDEHAESLYCTNFVSLVEVKRGTNQREEILRLKNGMLVGRDANVRIDR